MAAPFETPCSGLPVKERDWVVVGGTREELLHLNYREVGRDFPVFLHPDTHEEHALARLERKVAPGYRGFAVEFGPKSLWRKISHAAI